MKKFLPLLLILALVPALFTSCDDGYYPYYPGYDDYDNYLPGQWELISADGVPVSGYKVNYLDFYKNGTGIYYYYDRTVPYEMDFTWSVSFDYNSSVLYINYADGSYVSMDYWYNSNYTRLYTSWYSGGYKHTYVYQLVQAFSWGAPAKAAAADSLPADFVNTPFPGK